MLLRSESSLGPWGPRLWTPRRMLSLSRASPAPPSSRLCLPFRFQGANERLCLLDPFSPSPLSRRAGFGDGLDLILSWDNSGVPLIQDARLAARLRGQLLQVLPPPAECSRAGWSVDGPPKRKVASALTWDPARGQRPHQGRPGVRRGSSHCFCGWCAVPHVDVGVRCGFTSCVCYPPARLS